MILQRVRRRLVRRAQIIRRDHLDDFAFVHINKTGGSSVERTLGLPVDHRTALEWRDDLGPEAWERRYRFTVVRNPWDRAVSHYHYRVQTNQTSLGERKIGFREWLLRVFVERDPAYYDQPKMFMPQLDWVSDEEGALMVDRVCRFERLSDDISEVGKVIGRPLDLPHLKASQRGPYQSYYDDETRDVVSAWFRRDADAFGYAFDEPRPPPRRSRTPSSHA